MSGPLDGVLVVALEQAVAAPLATARLADAGARVIKVERAEGDFARGYDNAVHGESTYFVWLNRGKESLVADIKHPDDLALLRRILRQADVFVLNLAPGAAARAGLGAAEMRSLNPRLITCEISGYGSDNACRDMKAYDLLVQAESGLASVTGSATEPGRVGVSVADIAAGMYAESAIVKALLARVKSGQGEAIEVSLFGALADWMSVPLLHYDYGGRAPARVGIAHPSIAPYGCFRCVDGDVVLAVQNEREWRAFCTVVLERAELADDPRFAGNVMRVRHRDVLDRTIGERLNMETTEAVIGRLERAKVAFGRLNGVEDLSRHPALRRVQVDTPTGSVGLPFPPGLSDDCARSLGPVPALGAHSAALRREFAVD